MKTRIIQTKFWADDYISSLTTSEKIVFLYYLTNERVNIIHCYECPDRYVLMDTGVSREVLQKCKEKFEASGKMRFYNGYVKLLNAEKYERYVGSDNEKKKERLLMEMSPDVLDWYNNKKNTPVEREVTPLYTGTINHNIEIINNNIGVVKGKNKYITTEDVGEEDFVEIAEKYNVPLSFVRSKYEDMVLWAESRPNNSKLRGRNWRMTLIAFVKKDALNILQRQKGDPTRRVVDARDL